ncbi:general secretion pathway protein J [Thiothrix caldifontis]|jgi:general secretion pathway protein J|uniref:Type II secretion system protein J n=1 Tax=Thiothrix caldifontis TaxID=525918 RepID=A0A1H3VGN7_9GAMM|nr:type II secretion system minor pseudopilin GspJ [Thiothrix caldifontis]SDZ73348.1 general secretion pathway protein J [Thiothrix caldifontis]
MRRIRGFTLVELMISLAIFSLLITLAYQSVNVLLDAGRQVEQPQVELQQLQRAMVFVERDMRQLALLRPQSAGGIGQDVGLANSSIVKPEDLGALLEFTRGGHPDVAWQLRASGQMRSGLQRVRYVLEDGKLLRQTWNLVDHIEGEAPVSLILLDGVDGEPRFRFLSVRGGEFKDELPKERATLMAVEFSLRHKRFGVLRRIFGIYL